jgi:hypothetical protein
MGDSIGTTPFAAPGNPNVGSLFDTALGDDLGDDDDHFASPGNPDVGSLFPDARIADMPRFASPGNPSGVSG